MESPTKTVSAPWRSVVLVTMELAIGTRIRPATSSSVGPANRAARRQSRPSSRCDRESEDDASGAGQVVLAHQVAAAARA